MIDNILTTFGYEVNAISVTMFFIFVFLFMFFAIYFYVSLIKPIINKMFKKKDKPKIVNEQEPKGSKEQEPKGSKEQEPKGSPNGLLTEIEEMIDRKLDAFLEKIEKPKQQMNEKVSEDFDVGDVYEKKCEIKDISEWF